jgi:hypothetical protein
MRPADSWGTPEISVRNYCCQRYQGCSVRGSHKSEKKAKQAYLSPHSDYVGLIGVNFK